MHGYFPNRLEDYLDEHLSHLVFHMPLPDLAERVRRFLAGRGVSPVREAMVQKARESWLIVSLAQPDTRGLVLEMVGRGFGEGILGIDAKKVAK